MPELPPRHKRTIEAIYRSYEARADDWRRSHLGASLIGRECLRELWYSFRWAINPRHEGRLLRLFDTGHIEEERVIKDLEATGVEFAPPPDGQDQHRVSFVGGHAGGSTDGIGIGFLEAPKTWHLFEGKSANDKQFKLIQSKGVKEQKPDHYWQMQMYMHGLGLTRAFYVCVNKNTDEIYTERIHYVPGDGEAIVNKATMVVFAPEPLSKISEDPSWWKCKFCSARPICHLQQVDQVERNCRTCVSSTPTPDGKWWCEHHDKILDGEAQRKGCDDQLLIPALVPYPPEKVEVEERRITYATPDGGLVDHGAHWEKI